MKRTVCHNNMSGKAALTQLKVIAVTITSINKDIFIRRKIYYRDLQSSQNKGRSNINDSSGFKIVSN